MTHKLRILFSGIFLALLLATMSPSSASALTRKHGCVDQTAFYTRTWLKWGYLYRGNTFDVNNYAGDYAYGFAYGNINEWGYVNRWHIC